MDIYFSPCPSHSVEKCCGNISRKRTPPSTAAGANYEGNKNGSRNDSRFLRAVKTYLVFGVSAEVSAGLNEASFFIKRPLRRAAAFL
jgi:hypothetical protein